VIDRDGAAGEAQAGLVAGKAITATPIPNPSEHGPCREARGDPSPFARDGQQSVDEIIEKLYARILLV
jgi:hypothetical protein